MEWSIDKSFFQPLESAWGNHHIDLFATAANAKVPRYISWMYEETAWSRDAFNSNWSNMKRKPAFALGRAILIEMGVSALRPTSV